MPTTTLKSIIDRLQAVAEAAPLSLKPAPLPFSHDRIPNAFLPDSYWIDDGGDVSRRSQTSNTESRIDLLTIHIAKPLAFGGVAQFEALEDLIDDLYRRFLVDARTNGFNVEAAGRRVTHPEGKEFLIGSQGFRCDYDFSSVVS